MSRALSVIVLSCALAANAFAFGTKPGTHNVGSEHEKITRAAVKDLGPLTTDMLAGKGEDPGAVGAPDQSGRGLLANAPSHCDGGDFLAGQDPYAQTQAEAQAALVACREYVITQIDSAVAWSRELAKPTAVNTALDCRFIGRGSSAKCNVLEHLGLAFHTAQDFYANSNWVDRPAKRPLSATNAPGLGQSGPAKWFDPRQSIAFPDGLMSGCPGDLSLLGITFGCEYGTLPPLVGQIRILREDLSKDRGPIGRGQGGLGTSPRGKINGNFARAVSAAVEDTADKWAYFKEKIAAKYGATRAAKILCALANDKFDAARCALQVSQTKVCAERESVALGTTDADAAPQSEPTGDEIATAETLYPALGAFCVIEETDITRAEVNSGGTAEAGRASAKAHAVRALAIWNACPVQLQKVHQATAQRNKAAYDALINRPGKISKKEIGVLNDIYADCILGEHLRRWRK